LLGVGFVAPLAIGREIEFDRGLTQQHFHNGRFICGMSQLSAAE
jgi:hypothetical protein